MKLKLDKQKVTTLSSSEMNQLNGGGYKRSVRKNGTCNYSRTEEHAVISTFANDNGTTKSLVTSCKRSSTSLISVMTNTPTVNLGLK